MYVAWALLGAVLAWPILGALIGIAAALWKGFPVRGNLHRMFMYEQGL